MHGTTSLALLVCRRSNRPIPIRPVHNVRGYALPPTHNADSARDYAHAVTLPPSLARCADARYVNARSTMLPAAYCLPLRLPLSPLPADGGESYLGGSASSA